MAQGAGGLPHAEMAQLDSTIEVARGVSPGVARLVSRAADQYGAARGVIRYNDWFLRPAQTARLSAQLGLPFVGYSSNPRDFPRRLMIADTGAFNV